ncbi:MAG: hypothetical protein ACI4RN_03980 [Oscillospiraceae bacterium]
MSEVMKFQQDDFQVEFEVIPTIDESSFTDERKEQIKQALNNIDKKIDFTNQKISELNSEIDKLTNHADGFDYMVAVASGILAGIIDSVWVGEFSIDRANEFGENKVNNFVIKIAQKQGYQGNDLSGAVKFLEEKYEIVADKSTNDFGGGLQHHLRDFSHHPTIVGLFFSLLTQFTYKIYGTDVTGNFKIVKVSVSDMTLIGKNLPEKITFGVINWFFHMVSDMAGSSSSISKGNLGTGLPGPLVSFLKEISSLPIFRKLDKNGYKKFSVWISKLFNGTLLAKKDENGKIIKSVKFDLRTEIGVANELKRQAVPVIVNECIVRAFYFIRRLASEIKSKNCNTIDKMARIDWKATLPIKNRTIVRMLTISTGTFMTFDMADAAIRSAIKSGGNAVAFAKNFILKINFVGIGRFAIAIGSDVTMGVKRNKLRNERMQVYIEQIALLKAKVYYHTADMWIAAEDTGKSIEEAYNQMKKSIEIFTDSIIEIDENLNKISEYVPNIEDHNPGLIDNICNILKY